MAKVQAINFETLDLATAHERGAEIQVKHPQTGEPLEAWITIRGEESPAVQAFLQAEFDKERRRKDDDVAPFAELLEHSIEKAVVATISWRGVGWGDKAELECTPENCRRIYANKAIRAQILEAMAEEKNFPIG